MFASVYCCDICTGMSCLDFFLLGFCIHVCVCGFFSFVWHSFCLSIYHWEKTLSTQLAIYRKGERERERGKSQWTLAQANNCRSIQIQWINRSRLFNLKNCSPLLMLFLFFFFSSLRSSLLVLNIQRVIRLFRSVIVANVSRHKIYKHSLYQYALFSFLCGKKGKHSVYLAEAQCISFLYYSINIFECMFVLCVFVCILWVVRHVISIKVKGQMSATQIYFIWINFLW